MDSKLKSIKSVYKIFNKNDFLLGNKKCLW